tara:strand:+ start:295 stop:516 length:222 start_codon:yes stop_codon:yes gene_type:complete
MPDLTATITSFVTNDVPTSQGIQFRPISPENIDVKVWKWTRGSGSVHEVVKMPEAQKMAQKYRDAGWYEEHSV